MDIWYNRFYEQHLSSFLKKGKVLVIYGPRRVGKTSLIHHYLDLFKGKHFDGAGEDMQLKEILTSHSIQRIRSAFNDYELVIIDEAQKIKDIGTSLKIMVDHIPHLKIIASGSSSFRLSRDIGEPLTGRHKTILLYPLSMLEINNQFGGMHILENLEEFLIYGTYPEILTSDNINDKKDYLVNLRDSYLFRDILELENIRNADKLIDLLKLLAFQIGNEVSLSELSGSLGIAKQTVERYLDLFEKSFIIKKVRGFSRNLRKEITKNHRYYFYDTGLRNALINNFNDLKTRDDIGMLWENFLFIERLKKLHYNNIYANLYFWRTYDQKEIDLVEERDGKLFGYEFKWNTKKKKIPQLWLETYKNASVEIISKENFLEFIC